MNSSLDDFFPSDVLSRTGPDTLIQERAAMIRAVQSGVINAAIAVLNSESPPGVSSIIQVQVFDFKSSDKMMLGKLE